MPRGKPGTGTGDPKILAQFVRDVSKGDTQSSAAARHGLSARAFRSRAEKDPEFAQAFAEAKQEGASERADLVDKRFDEWVNEDDCAPALRIVWAKRWNPAYREKQQLEVSGPDGAPIELEGKRVTSLAEVFEFAQAIGAGLADGIGAATARDSLPPAPDVLPDPPDG